MMRSDFDEQLAVDEIVNDWIDANVVVWLDKDGLFEATLMPVVNLTAYGDTVKDAKFCLKMMMVGNPCIQFDLATAWLYGQLFK